jgi:hypothetical protein
MAARSLNSSEQSGDGGVSSFENTMPAQRRAWAPVVSAHRWRKAVPTAGGSTVEGVAVGAAMALRNGCGALDCGISGSGEVARWPWCEGAPAQGERKVRGRGAWQ